MTSTTTGDSTLVPAADHDEEHRPRALVLTGPGINCDGELAHAFELAGARAEKVLLSTLRRDPSIIDRFDLIGLPGGFSYGDDAGAGRIMAQLIRRDLYPALRDAIARSVPIIAPCNGFQIAVQAGLLPGPFGDVAWSDIAETPVVGLAPNRSGRFEDRWSGIEIPGDHHCVWTRGLEEIDAVARVLPSAHGEGRLVASSEVVESLERGGHVALRYAEGENFNGSIGRIAGLCDSTGLVLGLMPHPERYTRWTQHPTWTRLEPSIRGSEPPGLRMFRNAVAHAARLRS